MRPTRPSLAIPAPVRDVLRTFTKVAVPRLSKARRPKDLKALARDPELIAALGRDLTPIMDAAIRYALPVKRRWSTHLSATVTGAIGPLAANVAEGLVLAGPETLVVSAPTAVGVQFAAAVWEIYIEFSTIVQKLRDAGITDPDSVQLAIVRMVIPDATDLTKKLAVRGAERLAERMLARAATGWVPLAGPFIGSVTSNFDMNRAHRAADSVIRDKTGQPRRSMLNVARLGETRRVGEKAPRYVTVVDELEPRMFGDGFFEGWLAPPSPEEHLALLRNSTHRVVAILDDQVIGFATALSDRVLSAYIPLLEVLPEHRGKGIGAGLVRRLLSQIGPLYMVDVMCADDVFGFYEPLGFDKAAGGVVRNYNWKQH